MTTTTSTTTTTSFQVMPPLALDQVVALRVDIERHGIIVPIVVDQHGRVIDGHNRLQIARQLGIDCPTEVRHVADDDEALDLAVTLNCARRHLTREQVREVIAGEINRRPDDSDRAISRRVGCSPTTVGTVRTGRVSKLDTDTPESGLLTEEEARALTEETRGHLVACREAILVLVIYAMTNKVPVAEIVTALTQAIRSIEQERDNPQVTNLIRDVVYTPIIDYVLDPDTAELWRKEWDHETFLPLTKDEVQAALASLAGEVR